MQGLDSDVGATPTEERPCHLHEGLKDPCSEWQVTARMIIGQWSGCDRTSHVHVPASPKAFGLVSADQMTEMRRDLKQMPQTRLHFCIEGNQGQSGARFETATTNNALIRTARWKGSWKEGLTIQPDNI